MRDATPNPVHATITEQLDALIALDGAPLAGARAELAAAIAQTGQLAGAAIATAALDIRTARHLVTGAVYDMLRAARALDIDIEAELVAEISARNAERDRVDRQIARVVDAANRAGSA